MQVTKENLLKQLLFPKIHYPEEDVWQRIEAECPEEFQIIKDLLDKNIDFIIAGGFAAYIQGKTSAYSDIDVFVLENHIPLHFYSSSYDYPGAKFRIFNKPRCKLQIILHRRDETKSLMEQIVDTVLDFDLSVTRRVIFKTGEVADWSVVPSQKSVKTTRVLKYMFRTLPESPSSLRDLCMLSLINAF